MTNRGGAHFQGPLMRPRGPRFPRGSRGRGRGYQAQQGYRQLVQYTPNRNPGRPRGRGSRGAFYSNPTQPNPNPTPTISPNVAQNFTGGESVELKGFFTKSSTAKAFEERKRERLTSGSNIKCAKTGCEMMLPTGPHCLYCGRCSANQQHEETKLFKEAMAKFK